MVVVMGLSSAVDRWALAGALQSREDEMVVVVGLTSAVHRGEFAGALQSREDEMDVIMGLPLLDSSMSAAVDHAIVVVVVVVVVVMVVVAEMLVLLWLTPCPTALCQAVGRNLGVAEVVVALALCSSGRSRLFLDGMFFYVLQLVARSL